MPDTAAPTGWQTPDEPDDEMTRYGSQPVTQYEHAETDVSVQLVPIDPDPETADDSYRISVLRASTSNSDTIEPIANASDHGTALSVARDFMYMYNERCADGDEDLDAVLFEFSETD